MNRKISKAQIRALLGGGGFPMSATNWRRWWRRHDIHKKINMSESEFNRQQFFYLGDYEALKAVIGFEDSDLMEL